MTLVFVPLTKVTLRGGEETAEAANTRQSVHAQNGYLLLRTSTCISAVILATYIWALQLPQVSVYYNSQLEFIFFPLEECCARVWGHKIHIHACSSRATCIHMVYRAFYNYTSIT